MRLVRLRTAPVTVSTRTSSLPVDPKMYRRSREMRIRDR